MAASGNAGLLYGGEEGGPGAVNRGGGAAEVDCRLARSVEVERIATFVGRPCDILAREHRPAREGAYNKVVVGVVQVVVEGLARGDLGHVERLVAAVDVAGALQDLSGTAGVLIGVHEYRRVSTVAVELVSVR